jgi:hypothetical protein
MEPGELVKKYRSRGALIDTNLLLLVAVGIFNEQRIETFKRTRQYRTEDFRLLFSLLNEFHRLIVVPQVIAEADNLVRQSDSSEHPRLSAVMKELVGNAFEIYKQSSEIVQNRYFPNLGITDCAIIEASQDVLVMTDDARLSNILAHVGRDALNINHIRPLAWN